MNILGDVWDPERTDFHCMDFQKWPVSVAVGNVDFLFVLLVSGDGNGLGSWEELSIADIIDRFSGWGFEISVGRIKEIILLVNVIVLQTFPATRIWLYFVVQQEIENLKVGMMFVIKRS